MGIGGVFDTADSDCLTRSRSMELLIPDHVLRVEIARPSMLDYASVTLIPQATACTGVQSLFTTSTVSDKGISMHIGDSMAGAGRKSERSGIIASLTRGRR